MHKTFAVNQEIKYLWKQEIIIHSGIMDETEFDSDIKQNQTDKILDICYYV